MTWELIWILDSYVLGFFSLTYVDVTELIMLVPCLRPKGSTYREDMFTFQEQRQLM